jgi:hypothetical protein
MTTEEIAPWVEKEVAVTVRDGFVYTGSLMDTPEQGLYHVIGRPSRPGVIERFGPLADIWAHEIVSIEPKR